MATLVGGWLAVVIAGERPLIFSGIIAAFVLAGALTTIAMIPHPTWFTVATVAGIISAGVLAAFLASHSGGFGRAL
jgi:hypothetical protein